MFIRRLVHLSANDASYYFATGFIFDEFQLTRRRMEVVVEGVPPPRRRRLSFEDWQALRNDAVAVVIPVLIPVLKPISRSIAKVRLNVQCRPSLLGRGPSHIITGDRYLKASCIAIEECPGVAISFALPTVPNDVRNVVDEANG
jgi:hypothetical protein